MADQSPITRRIVVAITATVFGVTISEIEGQQRNRRLVRARFAACLLMSEMTPRPSLPQMGRALGNRDHTTILHAIARATGMMVESPEFADRVMEARQRIVAWRPGVRTGAIRLRVVSLVPAGHKKPPAVKIGASRPMPKIEVPVGGWQVEGQEHDWWRKNDLSFRVGMMNAHPERFGSAVEAAE